MKAHEETVLCRILKVTEQRTRPDWQHPQGRRRFAIDAARVADNTSPIWCSTLDPWKASLCQRYVQSPTPLLITIRQVTLHGRFGSTAKVYNLVHVETVPEQVTV